MNPFFERFASMIAPDSLVVDLGAGGGAQSERLVAVGAKVIAVDRKTPLSIPTGVEWITSDIDDWTATLPPEPTIDAFLLKNCIQFLEKDSVLHALLPRLASRLATGGIIGIETFSRAPEPSFSNSQHSYYSLQELKGAFSAWDFPFASEVTDASGADLAGNKHTFHLTRLIARKP
jgi:trans-aconitate methyltransferase